VLQQTIERFMLNLVVNCFKNLIVDCDVVELMTISDLLLLLYSVRCTFYARYFTFSRLWLSFLLFDYLEDCLLITD